jgi:hypothetical protein
VSLARRRFCQASACLRFCARKVSRKRRRLVEFTGVKNGVERGGVDLVFEALQRAAVLVLGARARRG